MMYNDWLLDRTVGSPFDVTYAYNKLGLENNKVERIDFQQRLISHSPKPCANGPDPSAEHVF